MHDDEDDFAQSYVRSDRHDWLRRKAWQGGFLTGLCFAFLIFYGVESYRALVG